MFWSAEADTSVVLLTDLPITLPTAGNLSADLRDPAARSDDQGTHWSLTLEGRDFRLAYLGGMEGDRPLTALVPLDADGQDRLEAIDRLLRALTGRPVPPDRRLTAQQRQRHRLMLQATDGRLDGASYRDIAGVIYGADRIAADPWKTSSLRDSTISLVKDGLLMVAGGYRQLLRHRRRD